MPGGNPLGNVGGGPIFDLDPRASWINFFVSLPGLESTMTAHYMAAGLGMCFNVFEMTAATS